MQNKANFKGKKILLHYHNPTEFCGNTIFWLRPTGEARGRDVPSAAKFSRALRVICGYNGHLLIADSSTSAIRTTKYAIREYETAET